MVIAIDFDHTIVNHDKEIEGAREAINILRERGHKIVIHSCNGKEWIEKVLRNLDIRYDYIWDQEGKPIATVYVDDRGLRFNGDWKETLSELTKIQNSKDEVLW